MIVASRQNWKSIKRSLGVARRNATSVAVA
jgi:hypothetical protein